MLKKLLLAAPSLFVLACGSPGLAAPVGSPAPASLQGIPNMGYALRQQGWSVISSVTGNLSNSSGTSVQSMYGTDVNGATVSLLELSPVSVPKIKLVFGNWLGNASPNDEGAASNDILVSAAAWNRTSGENYRALFNGEKTGKIKSRSIRVTDDVSFSVTAGTAYNLLEWCGGTAPTAKCTAPFDNVTTNQVPSNTLEGIAAEDITGGPVNQLNAGNTGSAYIHLFVLGFTGTSPQKSILCDGDSIIANAGDGSQQHTGVGGWCMRACNGSTVVSYQWPQGNTPPFGCADLARSGDTLANFVSANQNKMHLLAASFFTTVLSDRGTNDLGVSTLATMKANKLTEACLYLSQNVKFIAATLLPKTTSTDNWTTVANQTKGANETDRVGFNDWLRDGSASGFVKQAASQCGASTSQIAVYDAANAVEVNASNVLTQDGGFWLAPTGAATYTGSVTSGGSTSGFTDTSLSTTVNAYRGDTITWTSGANAGTNSVVIYDTAAQAVNALGFKNASASNGDAYKLWATSAGNCVYTLDGTHPTSCAHQLIAAGFNNALVQ